MALFASVGGGLTLLSGIVGRETAKGKAFAVAGSLINTYSAIAGQLKAFSGIPVPGYAIAQAISTGIVGFAAVKNILAVKVPGGKGGGSSPNINRPTTPNFNVVEASSVNQLNESIAGFQQEPVQAYVVSSAVTSQQALDRNIQTQAGI